MGGLDKGLVQFRQKTLVEHAIGRLKTQVDEIFINANREIFAYQAYGYPVLQDDIAGFIGPLAGFSLGLKQANFDYLLTVPCDSPLLPMDLVNRLQQNLLLQDADIAVASSAGDAHPVFSLSKVSALTSLLDYIQDGGRKVSAWQKTLRYIEVDFTDQAEAFANINTLADLTSMEEKCSQHFS